VCLAAAKCKMISVHSPQGETFLLHQCSKEGNMHSKVCTLTLPTCAILHKSIIEPGMVFKPGSRGHGEAVKAENNILTLVAGEG
jgi:hypothetical protein